MKITDIQLQAKNKNRVNLYIDGEYRLSLHINQIGDLGIKVGQEVSPSDLENIEQEGQVGKLYARALDYCLVRPRSKREIKDYLFKKTLDRQVKSKHTNKPKIRPGVSRVAADKVYDRLVDKGYVDDVKFAYWWVESRKIRTGISKTRLCQELKTKGVSDSDIKVVLAESSRDDNNELLKVLQKKRKSYSDESKLVGYLMRQGFKYDDIRRVLNEKND